MDALDINEKNTIQSIPTYFGGEEDDDIPDMEEFDEADNVVENDPVSFIFFTLSHYPICLCSCTQLFVISL